MKMVGEWKKLHYTKNEVLQQGFCSSMWLNPQETTNLVKSFTEKVLDG